MLTYSDQKWEPSEVFKLGGDVAETVLIGRLLAFSLVIK